MTCGIDPALVELLATNAAQKAIMQALKDGTLQGGLLDCAGQPLPASRQVVQCTDINNTGGAAATDTKLERGVLSAAYELQLTNSDNSLVPVDLSALRQPTVTAITGLEVVNDHSLRSNLSDGTTAADITLPVPTGLRVEPDTKEMLLMLATGQVIKADLCAWRGAQPCEYYATMQLIVERNGCDDTFRRVGYGFHPEDLRDPDADVVLKDCDGNVVAFIYSQRGGAHTLECYAEETIDGVTTEKLIGYALVAPIVRKWTDDCTC